jgi:hypothetical protein
MVVIQFQKEQKINELQDVENNYIYDIFICCHKGIIILFFIYK